MGLRSATLGGICAIEIPATAPAGEYDLRLFADDGYADWASTTVLVSPPLPRGDLALPT